MLIATYQKLVKDLEMDYDPSQLELIERLGDYNSYIIDRRSNLANIIKTLFSREQQGQIKNGMYIWGGVGRGKTMLIDLFFNSFSKISKRRYHFHQFMHEFHKVLTKNLASSKLSSGNAIANTIDIICKKSEVLCLDELQINNTGDAMLLQKILEAMTKKKIFIFITSNFMPEDLFKDGLQREQFLPCIDFINSHLEVFNLNNYKDYRMEKIKHIDRLYYWPLDQEISYHMQILLSTLLGEHEFSQEELVIDKNKTIMINNSYGNTAMFTFTEMCCTPLSSNDYFSICKRFSTIILTDIPQMTGEYHNEALRFITFIDCVYETKTKLICTAMVAIDNIYNGDKHKTEFKRTISRLHEMQSYEYASSVKN